MSSGFIEIAALGQQDVYLTGTPDVTYFSSVYKRHTPFVLEAFEIPFKASSITMGQNNIVRIPAKGDLIRATTLKLTLPPLAVYGQDWFWNEKPPAVLPTIVIDGPTYYATIPSASQYYSSNATEFAEWSASLAGLVNYDPDLNKFVITATNSVVVGDPNFTSLINSGVFWGFDPKNSSSSNGAGLLTYNAVNGKVIPDFTLEQAGWSRTIGAPINTLSGLFFSLSQTIDPEGYVSFSERSGTNLVWTNEDSPLAYVITPGGRINFTQAGLYMVRASFVGSNGNGTILIGSDGADGVPNSTNFWQTNPTPISTNSLIPYSIPITVTDVTQNWYVYIQGSPIDPGSYISVQPIDDYCGPSTSTPSITLIEFMPVYSFNLNSLGNNGGAITLDGDGNFTFNQVGQWLISGIINTPSLQDGVPSIITSVQLVSKVVLFTYDASGQLAESSSEFFIPILVSDTTNPYSLHLNTVNGTNGNVLSSSFVSFTYLALPYGGTAIYPTGGLILPLNGILFEPGTTVANPLNFAYDFNQYGVQNMISLDGSGNIQFNNVGTYMMTTYLPLVDPAALTWDSTLAWPNMFLSKQNLTVTAFSTIATHPTMLLSQSYSMGTKLMFRVSMDYVVGRTDCTSVGIGNLSMDTTSSLGSDTNSFGYFDSGTIYTGGSYSPPRGLPILQTSNVVDIAVDTTANMMLWVRIDGGQWTSSTGGIGGDPVAGTNGFDISYIGDDVPYKFGVNVFYDRDALVPGQITYNTWASSLVTPPSTAWDPILAAPYLELSNQNLTVTGLELLSRDDRDHPPMLLSNVFPTRTRLMFSVTMNYVVGTQTVVGIGNLSLNTSNFLGNDSNSFGYFDTGLPYSNGTIGTLTPGPLFFTRSVVDIAVDTTSNEMMWVRVDGGDWSSSDGAIGGDPSTADRGFDISYIGVDVPYKFGVNVWYDIRGGGGQTTFNTTALYAPPDGFTFVPGVGKTTDFNVPQGFTFVPGVAGTNHVTNINSYSNVNKSDSYFENLGTAITSDSNGSVYVLDPQNDVGGAVIAQVTSGGESSVFAGYKIGTNPDGSVTDGTGMSAILGSVGCMATDSNNYIYFGDYSPDKQGLLRVADPAQVVRTLAGGGPNQAPYDDIGLGASFGRIESVHVAGSNVYITDPYSRLYDTITGQVYTLNDASGVYSINPPYKEGYGSINTVSPDSNVYTAIYPTQVIYFETKGSKDDGFGNKQLAGIFPNAAGVYDGDEETTTLTNVTCISWIPDGSILVADNGRIRKIVITGLKNQYSFYTQTYTLTTGGGFVQNPDNPYINPNIIQFTYSNGSLYYTTQTMIMKLDLSTATFTTLAGTNQNSLKMSENTMYPVTIPVRVDSAPMSYPVTVGHDDEFFAPGAFVWVYPITSGILPPDYKQYHYYDSVGTWAIESADLKIGGQSIQTLSGEYIEIWNDLNIPYENQPALTLLTGKNDTTIATGRDYYVNLPFYFYEKSQNYLPMCSLSRQDVEIHVTFRTLQALTAIPVVATNPVQATLIVEYVYLDTPELNWFTKTRLEYVIDQAQYQEIDLTAGLTQDNFILNFRNPVNALFFAIQVNGALPYDWTNDGLQRMGLSFNGEEIMLNRITDATQLGVIEPFNNFINFPTRNFYMKTFKSPINFSRIRYVLLGLNIYRSDAYYPAKQLRITAVSKNVLQINDGLGGLMFISQ